MENNEYECYKKIKGRIKSKNQALYLWGEQELDLINFCGIELHKKVFRKLKSIANNLIFNDTKYDDFVIPYDSSDEENYDQANEEFNDEEFDDDFMEIESWDNNQTNIQRSTDVIPNINEIFKVPPDDNIETSSDSTSSSLNYSNLLSSDGNDESSYDVEFVSDYRILDGTFQYLIKWFNYDALNWINADECDCQEFIDDFWARVAVNMD